MIRSPRSMIGWVVRASRVGVARVSGMIRTGIARIIWSTRIVRLRHGGLLNLVQRTYICSFFVLGKDRVRFFALLVSTLGMRGCRREATADSHNI